MPRGRSYSGLRISFSSYVLLLACSLWDTVTAGTANVSLSPRPRDLSLGEHHAGVIPRVMMPAPSRPRGTGLVRSYQQSLLFSLLEEPQYAFFLDGFLVFKWLMYT